jgi:hypothetical protein
MESAKFALSLFFYANNQKKKVNGGKHQGQLHHPGEQTGGDRRKVLQINSVCATWRT